MSSSSALNLPATTLLTDDINDYTSIVVPLYQASVIGDWRVAGPILEQRPEAVRLAITSSGETPLMVAASSVVDTQIERFVANLVTLMTVEDLTLVDMYGNTALLLAASHGSRNIADTMLERNMELLTITDHENRYPITISAKYGNQDMTDFLYNARMGQAHWTVEVQTDVVIHCIENDMFGMALRIMTDHNLLGQTFVCGKMLRALAWKHDALNRKENKFSTTIGTILEVLHLRCLLPAEDEARRAVTILQQVVQAMNNFLPAALDSMIRGEGRDNPYKSLFVAAANGNTRYLLELIRVYPDVLRKTDANGHTIFHMAIMHRHLDLYNMLRYELGSKRIPSLVPDNRGNTPLHLVGLTSRKAQLESMSRSTLMLQREYLWFQEVEKMLTPHLRSLRNDDGKTAYELFQENTIDLASSGLRVDEAAMVGAALIVTVSFAAVLTPPGGYNQETGFPIFMKQPFFLVYLITTGFSLLSSSLTFLILLSIITSRSRPHDFLRVLPRKVIATLISLFLSVLSLMAAYAACCIVLYRAELKWIPICLGLVASLPVFIFAALQFPIWLEIVLTTYRPTHLFNPKIGLLYPKERR